MQVMGIDRRFWPGNLMHDVWTEALPWLLRVRPCCLARPCFGCPRLFDSLQMQQSCGHGKTGSAVRGLGGKSSVLVGGGEA